VSPGGGAAEAADRERTLAAPATRRVARDLGVDIDRVPAVEQRDGHAFVTEAAVREFAQADAGAPATRTGGEAAAAAATPEPAGSAGAAPGTTAPSVEASAEGTPVGEERIPYRGIRRTIGQRMEQSKYTAPHVTHHDSTPVSGLVDLREQLKPEMPEDVSLTYLPFVMKAVVAGLREYPAINATLDTESEEIVQKKYYNLGVATATDAGLMVPVVDNVGEKGIVELARETGRLVERARSREIAREEMQGGTFTITNFGAIGGDHATPIINYPEAAILGLGAIEERPVAEDGEVIARTTLPLSLSVDHRLIDGAVAAGFTNEVKRHLNNPSLLMLW
jgi:pyruvate dehydrogenase E2 component (dihydrolipoamide acetyltransferase)